LRALGVGELFVAAERLPVPVSASPLKDLNTSVDEGFVVRHRPPSSAWVHLGLAWNAPLGLYPCSGDSATLL
jgi:hypothetical protein